MFTLKLKQALLNAGYLENSIETTEIGNSDHSALSIALSLHPSLEIEVYDENETTDNDWYQVIAKFHPTDDLCVTEMQSFKSNSDTEGACIEFLLCQLEYWK